MSSYYGELVMNKKYIVRLSGKERSLLLEIVKKLKGTSQKVRRATILLKADANQNNWPDNRIAEALTCRVRKTPPTAKILDGKQEAELIALRLGSPPKGFVNWSLRLLANKAVELEIVESISYETVRRTLKKTI